MTRTIPARRPGICPECGAPFPTGEPIAPIGRARRAPWGHVECAHQYARNLHADDLDALTYGGGL